LYKYSNYLTVTLRMKKISLFLLVVLILISNFVYAETVDEYLLIAQQYFNESRFQELAVILEEAIKFYPDKAILHVALGSAYFHLYDYNKSLSLFTHAIELDKMAAETYNMRAGVYEFLKDYKKAIDDINMTVLLEPENGDRYNDRAVFLSKILGEHDKAINDYNEAIRLNSKELNYFVNRGVSFFHLERHAEAMEDFDTAIRLDNNDSRGYFNRGFLNTLLKRYNEAVLDFTEVIRIDPNNSDAFFNRAVAYKYLSNLTDDPLLVLFYRNKAMEDEAASEKLDSRRDKQ